MKRVLALLLAYMLYLGIIPTYADVIISPDISPNEVKYTSSLEVYLPEHIIPQGITEMDSAIRSVGSVDNFINEVDKIKTTGVYEIKNEALSKFVLKTKNFVPKRTLKENPWFTRKPKGKDVETRKDIHLDYYDPTFITNPMHHTKYKYFNIEAYQDYQDWLTFVDWDGKLGKGYGFAYIDKYGFTHVCEDFRTAMVYSADGNLYIYEGEYEAGYAIDAKGNRFYLKAIPNSINFGNYEVDTDRFYNSELRKFDESKYVNDIDPDNYLIEWDIADFGYDEDGNPIQVPDTFKNSIKNDEIPIDPIANSTISVIDNQSTQETRESREVREKRESREQNEPEGTLIIPSN